MLNEAYLHPRAHNQLYRGPSELELPKAMSDVHGAGR